jgi:hypothetical protein
LFCVHFIELLDYGHIRTGTALLGVVLAGGDKEAGSAIGRADFGLPLAEPTTIATTAKGSALTGGVVDAAMGVFDYEDLHNYSTW